MEEAKVYFTSFKATGNENLLQKLHRLMKTAGFEQIDFQDKYAAIKIHFGEYGNSAMCRRTVTAMQKMIFRSSRMWE